MALKTQQVHIAALEEPRIHRPMRSVATHATFGFNWGMFKDEGPGLLSVAGEARRILSSSRAQIALQVATVWIVTVIAADQLFVDTVMEGF